jgi:hypothetical protein
LRVSRRNVLAVAVSLGVAISATAATAADSRDRSPYKRVVTITYDHPCEVFLTSMGTWAGYCPIDQGFTTRKNEKFASIVVTDKSGSKVPIAFAAESTDAVGNQAPRLVCGSSSHLTVTLGADHYAHPTAGDVSCPAPATSGAITITLTEK